MKRYVELGFTCMHIDSHRHLHCSPSILSIVIPLAKKYGFKTMRISRNMGELLSFDKKIIKSYVNNKIKRSFEVTNLFGGYEDYIYAGCPKTESVEIMVHPDIVNGECVDVTEGVRSTERKLLSSIVI